MKKKKKKKLKKRKTKNEKKREKKTNIQIPQMVKDINGEDNRVLTIRIFSRIVTNCILSSYSI